MNYCGLQNKPVAILKNENDGVFVLKLNIREVD